MADIKISQLNTASEIQDSDNIELSQDINGVLTSTKTSIDALSTKVTSGVVNSIATVEVSPSANNYAVGDYLMYNRQLYKVISAITSGQTLVVGTNIQAVAVTDEMGSGGGGTGGHTIIDENGNSMTARAGLQFVGADVSDDGTNNKTIVDLASAGGIDGVFIDTENVIKSSTNFTNSLTYTATEDCAFCLYLVTQGSISARVKIDGTTIIDYWKSSMDTPSFPPIFLKKGQVVTVENANQTYDSTYRVYGIQTGTTHSKFQPVIYSTEEREIGVWEDGRPLYAKTYILTSGSPDVFISHNSWTPINEVSLTDEFFIDATAISDDGTAQGSILAWNNNGTLNLQTPRNSTGYVKYLNVQYIRTSDVAGSGTWTPQGVPAVHYSTDEQVIGTWIDGSTLYEKTIDFGALPNNDVKSVNHSISNLSKIISYNAVTYRNDGITPDIFDNIPNAYPSSNGYQYAFHLTGNGTSVSIRTGTDQSVLSAYVTLQYTKTS